MELLLTKTVVVALAIIGALVSTAASMLQSKRVLSERSVRLLNYSGYAAMGLSMLLFVLAGLWGVKDI